MYPLFFYLVPQYVPTYRAAKIKYIRIPQPAQCTYIVLCIISSEKYGAIILSVTLTGSYVHTNNCFKCLQNSKNNTFWP
jgi:hypothetical protein